MPRARKSFALFVLLGGAVIAGACADAERPAAPASGGAGGGKPEDVASGESGVGEHAGARSGDGGDGGGSVVPRVCTIQAPTACPDPMPVYDDVAPIFAERCVICHNGRATEHWPLSTYGHVSTWRDTIRAALLKCQMPPVDSGYDIPQAESERILDWIRCGMPF